MESDNFRTAGRNTEYLYALSPAGHTEKSALASVILVRAVEDYDLLTQEIMDLQAKVRSNEIDGG